MVYKSKDEYMGNWLDGKKHGKGIYIWRDNSMYIGEFKIIKWMAMEYVMIAMEI